MIFIHNKQKFALLPFYEQDRILKLPEAPVCRDRDTATGYFSYRIVVGPQVKDKIKTIFKTKTVF